MDRSSRTELAKTVEAQQEKIQKYESKLRDLISAYKSVVKEKEALEASVKALSLIKPTTPSTPKPAAPTQGDEDRDDDGEERSVDGEDGGNGEEVESTASQEEVTQLQERLVTLTSSLMTVTEEKSKLEANFVADKKKMRIELEERSQELEDEKKHSGEMIQQMTQDLQEWKNRLRSQQHEREKEHHDHAMMLRELQRLLGDERASKETLENQVDDLKQELEEKKNSTANNDEKERLIHDLAQEQASLREKLEAEREKAQKPIAEVLQLRHQLEELETQHQLSLQREQKHASEFETMMSTKAMDSEMRTSQLEAKVSELSEVVGNYERLRFQDQQAIQKLKEKTNLLGIENMALTQAMQRKTTPEEEFKHLEESTDVHEILDKMVRLKQLAKNVNSRSEKPEDLEALLQSTIAEVDPQQALAKSREDYERLKEDFERYKLRAQSVLKSKSSKDSSPSVEVDGLKSQVAELKDRLYQLRGEFEEQGAILHSKEEAFRSSVASLTEKHTEEVARQAEGYRKRAAEQELEIRRHRERTIALLAEKDRELELFRQQSTDRGGSGGGSPLDYVGGPFRQLSSDPEEVGASSAGGPVDESMAAVSELLSRTPSALHPGAPGGETTLLHFAQEQARKEVDVQNLRRQKHGLESALRDLQHSALLKEQHLLEQVDLLKEEIRRHERNVSRENANLEYLKNVVYHFMVSTDKMAKVGTLNAIALILQFSPKEKDKVRRELDRGWWNYAQNLQKIQKTQI